jgi:hypothetical protein
MWSFQLELLQQLMGFSPAAVLPEFVWLALCIEALHGILYNAPCFSPGYSGGC